MMGVIGCIIFFGFLGAGIKTLIDDGFDFENHALFACLFVVVCLLVAATVPTRNYRLYSNLGVLVFFYGILVSFVLYFQYETKILAFLNALIGVSFPLLRGILTKREWEYWDIFAAAVFLCSLIYVKWLLKWANGGNEAEEKAREEAEQRQLYFSEQIKERDDTIANLKNVIDKQDIQINCLEKELEEQKSRNVYPTITAQHSEWGNRVLNMMVDIHVKNLFKAFNENTEARINRLIKARRNEGFAVIIVVFDIKSGSFHLDCHKNQCYVSYGAAFEVVWLTAKNNYELAPHYFLTNKTRLEEELRHTVRRYAFILTEKPLKNIYRQRNMENCQIFWNEYEH